MMKRAIHLCKTTQIETHRRLEVDIVEMARGSWDHWFHTTLEPVILPRENGENPGLVPLRIVARGK